MSELVHLAVEGDETIVSFGDVAIAVPTTLVSVVGGRAMIEVTERVALALPATQVAIIAHHPEPTIERMAEVVGSLNADQVTALMAQESRWSSLDDPIGMVAMRAVARAIRGETPESDPGDLGGL